MNTKPSTALAKCVLAAAKLREGSFDSIAADAYTEARQGLDFNQFYGLSIAEASTHACRKAKYADLSPAVTLLLTSCWNESLDWAQEVIDAEAAE